MVFAARNTRVVKKSGETNTSGNSANLAEQLELGKRSQEEYCICVERLVRSSRSH